MPSWKHVNPPYKFKWTKKTVLVPEGSSETTTELSQQAATRNRGKAIVNSPPPTYDQESTMVAKDDEMSKEKEIDKLMALISLSFKKIYKPTNNNLRTSSNTSRENQDNTPRINIGTRYDNHRVVNVAGARENVEEAGIQLSAEQAVWRDDSDDEPNDQELEAHYMHMAQIQEVTPDNPDNSRPIFDDDPLQKVQNNDDNYNVLAIESEHPKQPESVNDTYLEKQGVIPTTSVRRPQFKSNQLEDRVMPNNSQGKKQEVEDHHRNFKFSNNITSVTACNDSLNAKTSNVNFVCVACGKCVLNDNHDMCVLHYINGVNSRTKILMVVPIKIILFIVDSVCSKHMTGNLKLLSNFVEKFLGTVKFENDQIAPILGYGIFINQSPRGIFINQAKYAQEILIKHCMTSCDSIASGPYIVHATYYCARYQAKPTEKHLTTVKRIFWYLKDTINMRLWYPKDTGFELTAILDSDHVGCLDSCKIASGGIQFLGGDKLVSWSSKKQDCTSMSSAEAEYVSLSACCAQVLWLRT
ncbi:hypothetical protein Tco_0908201 [Tanacetum coccineum]|uniref:Retrovirus-related Pol polyprotein from transposon TNT 1-94-like beta-barrel domain-containing protein n=1 Tax=Tanacetum coccineum TaxID=301880 RepID=A0ABQ5CLH4_9ASTR